MQELGSAGPPPPDTAEVAAWLDRNAVPIGWESTADTGDDLSAIERMLDGVSVVGLGEVTHGTREFYLFKHRLLRHLVTAMGFTVLAIEGSYSSAQVVNDHLVNGRSERSAALSRFGHAMWDVEEFGETLDWIGAYNRSAPSSQKTHLCGLDMWNTEFGRAHVLAYLRRVAPERLAAAERVFGAVATSESRGILPAHRDLDIGCWHLLRDLMEFLVSDRARLVEMTSPDAHEEVLRHVAIIRQWIACNISDQVPDEIPADVPPMKGFNIFARSVYLGMNLIDLLARSGPDAKVVVWAHTLHTGVGFDDAGQGRRPNMGKYLRSQLGDRYYAFAMEFDHGTYLARDFLPDQTLGDHRVGTVPSAPHASLPWYLSLADSDNYLLDLRQAGNGRPVAGWLTRCHTMHCAGWGYSDPPLSTTVRLNESYDGLIFIRETSSTTPTPNAVRAVSRRTVH